jgi:hypothetical protein
MDQSSIEIAKRARQDALASRLCAFRYFVPAVAMLSQPTQSAGLPQIVESLSEECPSLYRYGSPVIVGQLHSLQRYAAADYCSVLSYNL